MNKEQTLDLLKDLVLKLKTNPDMSDTRRKADFLAKTQLLNNAVKSLNSCDLLWINDKYGTWFEKEIYHKLPAHTLKLINTTIHKK